MQQRRLAFKRQFRITGFLLGLLTGWIFYSGAQTARLDSLRRLIYPPDQHSVSIQTVLDACSNFYSLHPDSLHHYVLIGRGLLSKEPEAANEAALDYYTSIYLSRQGNESASMKRIDFWLNKPEVRSLGDWYYRFLVAKNVVLVRENKHREALERIFNELHEAERRADRKLQMRALIHIGWIYMELNQSDEAVRWLMQALQLDQKNEPRFEPAPLYSNLAAVYSDLKKYDSALILVQRAIQLAREQQDITSLCNAFYIQSDIYTETGNIQLAERSLLDGLATRRLVGDAYYIVSDLAQAGKFYTRINEFQKGKRAIQEGIQMAQQQHLPSRMIFLYSALADNLRAAGNWETLDSAQQVLMQLKDSQYLKNNAESLSELQERYEVQQREKTIVQQQLHLVQKNYVLYATIGTSLAGFLLLWIIFRNYRRREKQKLQLLEMASRLREEQAATQAGETERKRIAKDLHDQLGAYAAAISASAEQLAHQHESPNHTIQELGENARSMVAHLQDTIWALNRETLLLTAISDRIKISIQRLERSYPNIVTDVVEEISNDISFPPHQALHLFYLLQEALVNAFRHSGGNRIKMIIRSAGSWEIRIEDNGRGIGIDQIKGNGLMNMQERAAVCGWILNWEVVSSGGTSVSVAPATTNSLQNDS